MLESLRDWPTLRLSAHPCQSPSLRKVPVCGWLRGSLRASFYEVLRYMLSKREKGRFLRKSTSATNVRAGSIRITLLASGWPRGMVLEDHCLCSHPPRAYCLWAHLPSGQVAQRNSWQCPPTVNTAICSPSGSKTLLLASGWPLSHTLALFSPSLLAQVEKEQCVAKRLTLLEPSSSQVTLSGA